VCVWMMSCGSMGTASCGVLGIITVLVFVGVGCLAFEAFDPIRGVNCGRNDGSWALLQHPQRSAASTTAVNFTNHQSPTTRAVPSPRTRWGVSPGPNTPSRAGGCSCSARAPTRSTPPSPRERVQWASASLVAGSRGSHGHSLHT